LLTGARVVPFPGFIRHAGVTLAEMLVVTAVLALGASIAIPNASLLATASANAGATEIVQAIRFAQREAIRTGAWHAVNIDPAAQTLRIYRLTGSGLEDTSTAVVHPIDKRPYSIAFSASGATRTTITLVDFDYEGAGNTNLTVLSFGADGTPALLTGNKAPDIKPMKAGIVTIKTGATLRSFAIDNVTGRVTG
jgi:prepilin-type N-terminal cleavage/methylation domain-containing protein